MDIKKAIASLDVNDDNLWTSNGLPRLGAISEVVGQKVTREDLQEHAPDFTRDNAMELDSEKAEVAEAAEVALVQKPVAEMTTDDLLKAARDLVEDKKRALYKAQAELNDAVAAEDALIVETTVKRDPNYRQRAIMDHIKSHNSRRSRR